MQRFNRRKDKRHFNRMQKVLRVGSYVEDCRNHPCIITDAGFSRQDIRGAWIDVRSLVTGTMSGCSVFHCDPLPLTKAEAEARVAFLREHSWDEYLVACCGYSQAALDHHHKLDAVWGFEKAGTGSAVTPGAAGGKIVSG